MVASAGQSGWLRIINGDINGDIVVPLDSWTMRNRGWGARSDMEFSVAGQTGLFTLPVATLTGMHGLLTLKPPHFSQSGHAILCPILIEGVSWRMSAIYNTEAVFEMTCLATGIVRQVDRVHLDEEAAAFWRNAPVRDVFDVPEGATINAVTLEREAQQALSQQTVEQYHAAAAQLTPLTPLPQPPKREGRRLRIRMNRE